MFDWLSTSFEVVSEMKLVGFFFGAAVLFSLFLFITAQVNFWIRFVGIPIILALCIWGYAELDSILGYPYPGIPPTEVVLLGYTIQSGKDHKLELVIWVRDKDGTRLYKFPWTKKTEEKLKEAMKKQQGSKGKEGGGTQYKFSRGESKDPGDILMYEFNHQGYPEKPGSGG